eukprot:Sdes_comp20543_c0_seq1m15250
MNLFSKAKKAPPAKESIQKLRETLELLEKRENYLEKKIENELLVAKKNASKNKRIALMALKRKKTYEAQIEKITGARMTIETQVLTIENANVNLEAMNAMKMGAATMKNIHGTMTIEKVDETMDEIREQMDVANEIGDAISQPVGFGIDFDDEELNAELDELEQEELDKQLLDTEISASDQRIQFPSSTLPAVPTTEPAGETQMKASSSTGKAGGSVSKKKDKEEEDELEELRAAMAM